MPVAHRVRKILTLTVYLATLGVICWAFAYPYPVRVVIGLLVAIPWIAIGLVVLSKGAFLFSFDDDMIARPGNVALLILVSSLALPIIEIIARPEMPTWPLDWPSSLIPALFGGLLLAILVNTVFSMTMGVVLHRLHWITSCVCFSLSTLGAIIAANGLLDQGPPETFAVVITDGHATPLTFSRYGGSGPVSLGRLSPFHLYYYYDFSVRSGMSGQYDGPNPVSVPSSLFRSKHIGDTVCVYMHPGALQKRWISVDNCVPARADRR